MKDMKNDDWDDAAAVKVTPRKRLSAVVTVRLAPDEEEVLRQVAEAKGISLSQLVRDAVSRQCALEQAAPRDVAVQPEQGTAGLTAETKLSYDRGSQTGEGHSRTSPLRLQVTTSR